MNLSFVVKKKLKHDCFSRGIPRIGFSMKHDDEFINKI